MRSSKQCSKMCLVADGNVGWVLWSVVLNDSKRLGEVLYKNAISIINVVFKYTSLCHLLGKALFAQSLQ